MKENKIPFKQLCKEFNISEKTGYKWKNRFEETGDFSSLQDQSKAPKSNANQLDEDTIIAILSLKKSILSGELRNSRRSFKPLKLLIRRRQ